MPDAAEQFQQFLQMAENDPAVVGVVLTGSRGKGFATDQSDYDVRIVTRDEAYAAFAARFDPERWSVIDAHLLPLTAFTTYADLDGPFAWDRFSFANAPVLIDKTGTIHGLVDAKGRLPIDRTDEAVRTALDAYINSVYRSLKRLRNGDVLGARLEAAGSIPSALTTI